VTADASNRLISDNSQQMYRESLKHLLNAQGRKVFEDNELQKFHFECKEKTLEFFDEQPKFGNEEHSKPFKTTLKSVREKQRKYFTALI
jgi:hypothetical protein